MILTLIASILSFCFSIISLCIIVFVAGYIKAKQTYKPYIDYLENELNKGSEEKLKTNL